MSLKSWQLVVTRGEQYENAGKGHEILVPKNGEGHKIVWPGKEEGYRIKGLYLEKKYYDLYNALCYNQHPIASLLLVWC